jgi:glycosyltransferase involved in cell wall biosynthesis
VDLEELPAPGEGKEGWPWTDAPPPLPSLMPDGSPWPKITIVTPSYNQVDYIEETIRSVLLQGYPALEYMIFDAGSTDGSIDVIERYSRWLSWTSEPDRGQSDAINKGWRKASGDLVSWINSDDLLAPGALRRVAEVYREVGDVGFVHGKARLIDEVGRTTGERGSYLDLPASLKASKNTVAQPSAFIPLKTLNRTGLLDESLHMSMDWDIWLRAAAVGGNHFVDEEWSWFRETAVTKTSTNIVGFGPNHLQIVKKLFEQPGLPRPVLSVKRRALASAGIRSAKGYLRGQEPKEARRAFVAAVFQHPGQALKEARPHALQLLLAGRLSVAVVRAKRFVKGRRG